MQTAGDSGKKTIRGTVDARDFGEVSAQGAVITITLESTGKRSKGRLSASGGDSTTIRLRAPSEQVAALWFEQIQAVIDADGSVQAPSKETAGQDRPLVT